jgi:hypothetical protein
MSRARAAATGVAVLRIAYGAALATAPARVTQSWLGADASRPAAGVALRALGAREVALHAGAVFAALSGGAVRPWLLASIGGDCSDVLATFGGRAGLPSGAAGKTLVVAGGSALLSGAVLAAVDS